MITEDDNAPRSIHASDGGGTAPFLRMRARVMITPDTSAIIAGSTAHATVADACANWTMNACTPAVLAAPRAMMAGRATAITIVCNLCRFAALRAGLVDT